MKQTSLIAACVLALLLGIGMSWRMYQQKRDFDKTVKEALKTSEGYDQKFINMVNRLEHELALRASFGYTGARDPMTGKRRRVVTPPRTRPKPAKETPEEKKDPMKLTAIIYDDDAGRHTAIVMHEERSYSVEVGDRVAGRRVTKITNEIIYMEDDSTYYKYDIYGRKAHRSKGE